jgi:hypothetical protein
MGNIQVQVSSQEDDILFLTKDLAVTSRTWVKNDVGTATLAVPYSHPRMQDLAAYGNIIRIRERGIQPWVGQVVNRSWDSTSGVVSLACKSAEWMLQKKITGQGRTYVGNSGYSAGTVAYAIFENAAIANNDLKQLKAGIFKAAAPVHREFNYADLFDALQDLAEDYTADFWVDETLRVHFTDRGVDRRERTVLREGRHLSGVRVTDSAEEMITAVIGIGAGDSIVKRPKYLRKLKEAPFFRAEAMDVSGVGAEAGLVEPVEGHLKKDGLPRVTVDASVERINGTYGDFWIGDTVTLITRHPFLRRIDAEVIGIERGETDSLRVVFSVVTEVTSSNIVPWTVI